MAEISPTATDGSDGLDGSADASSAGSGESAASAKSDAVPADAPGAVATGGAGAIPASSQGTAARFAVPALAVAGLIVSLMQTLVLPLLPEFMQSFHTSVATVTWVFTATLLAGAVATPLLSRFGDMYGKKKMIMVAMVMLVIGSLICAVSGSLALLILGRAFQGVSSAMIPLAIGVIRDVVPRERVMTSIGIVSATLGVGGGLGLLVTGLINQHTTSYRPVFWISVVIGALGLVLVAAFVPGAVGENSNARPDLLGAGLLAVWLVCLLLAISDGPAWGWGSGGVIGLFAAAVVFCAVWVVVEQRVAEPLVRLNLLVGPRSLSTNVASMLLGFGMYAVFTLFTNLVQTPKKEAGYGLSGSVLDVGLFLLPETVGAIVFSALAGRFERRIGAAYALAVGSVFIAGGTVWLAVESSHVYDMVSSTTLQGIGFGIAYAALGALAVQHVPMDSTSIASGINSLVRTAGGSIGAAVTGSILSSQVIAHTDLPELHAYVISFVILTAGTLLAAAVAAGNGLRYGSRPPATH
jgi:MFS family permease